MEHVKVQRLLDQLAISASALCLMHCLITPFLLVAVPVLSSTFLAGEAFHRFMVIFVLPLSGIALYIGCRDHKDSAVIALGGLGLIALVTIAFFGHDLLGETGEKIATVISAIVLSMGHLRNYRLCREKACDS